MKTSIFTIFTTLVILLTACEFNPTPTNTGDKSQSVSAPDKAAQINAKLTKRLNEVESAILQDDLIAASKHIKAGLSQTHQLGTEFEVWHGRFVLQKGILLLKKHKDRDARRFLADALAIFRIRAFAEGSFQSHLVLSRLEEDSGDLAAADRELDSAQKLLKDVSDPELRADFTFRQAELKSREMNFQESAKLYLDATTQYKATKNVRKAGQAYIGLALCEDSLGNAREASRSLKKAYDLLQKANDRNGAVKALHRMALLALRDENYAKAKKLLTETRAMYKALGRYSDATKVNQHISALPE